MVFFNCTACGESLKKNQVEKHYQFKCRNCSCLACVDCGKEFWGDDYQTHIKCISEEEKYSGKDYKPKPNANKGERKQESWIQQVQDAISNANAEPHLKSLLKRIQNFENIPRKKGKFENFVGNSMRVKDKMLITKAWDAINAHQSESKSIPTANGNLSETDNLNGNQTSSPRKRKQDSDEVLETKLSKTASEEEFKWRAVITELLQAASENQLSMKKLRKKVLSRFTATPEGESMDEEKKVAKFEKKLKKHKNVQIIDNKVKLCV